MPLSGKLPRAFKFDGKKKSIKFIRGKEFESVGYGLKEFESDGYGV